MLSNLIQFPNLLDPQTFVEQFPMRVDLMFLSLDCHDEKLIANEFRTSLEENQRV